MTEKTYTFTKKQLNFERIQTIAKFASMASHELKNSVGGLSNIAYYLSKSMKAENETQQKMLELLSKEVSELNKKITEVLDMTRVKQITKTTCDLQNVLLLAISETQVPTVAFEQSLISAKIYGDPERLKQAFSNIILNSREAMKDTGRIQISMQIISDTVIISIADFGTGMKPEVLEQCLDPMFSTKIAKAIGMGLPIAQQIIEMHNGTIKINSESIKGTTVIISLPLQKK